MRNLFPPKLECFYQPKEIKVGVRDELSSNDCLFKKSLGRISSWSLLNSLVSYFVIRFCCPPERNFWFALPLKCSHKLGRPHRITWYKYTEESYTCKIEHRINSKSEPVDSILPNQSIISQQVNHSLERTRLDFVKPEPQVVIVFSLYWHPFVQPHSLNQRFSFFALNAQWSTRTNTRTPDTGGNVTFSSYSRALVLNNCNGKFRNFKSFYSPDLGSWYNQTWKHFTQWRNWLFTRLAWVASKNYSIWTWFCCSLKCDFFNPVLGD